MSGVSFLTSGSTSSSLLGRVRQRDPEAWRRFADIYTPLVYAWARRGGLRENDAADIVQEVFRTVAAKIDDFGKGHVDGSFRGWMFAITRNQVRLYYRKLYSRPEATGGTDAAVRLENVPAWNDSESEVAAGDDRRFLLHQAMQVIRGDFGEKTWQAFWRTVVSGETATEAANALGMTAGSVRQAKFRVLCRLREELDGV